MDFRNFAEQFLLDSFCKEPPITPPEDMSKGEIGILTYLTFIQNNILSGELSKNLRISSGRIAIALKSLEKKKYILRSVLPSDKRKVIVCATPDGIFHAKVQKEKAITQLTQIFQFLGEKDSEEFVRILYRIFNINK